MDGDGLGGIGSRRGARTVMACDTKAGSLVNVGGTGFAAGEVETLELIRRPYPGIVHVFAWR